MNAKELQEKLFRPSTNGWEKVDPEKKQNILDFSNGYIKFLNSAKTERECTKEIEKILNDNGFKDIRKLQNIKAGEKIYYINRHKNVYAAVIGTDNLENGFNIIGSHIDLSLIHI